MGNLPKWVRAAAVPNHVWLAGVALVCMTLVYILRGSLPVELIGAMVSLVGISGGSNALVRAADNMQSTDNDNTTNKG